MDCPPYSLDIYLKLLSQIVFFEFKLTMPLDFTSFFQIFLDYRLMFLVVRPPLFLLNLSYNTYQKKSSINLIKLETIYERKKLSEFNKKINEFTQ